MKSLAELKQELKDLEEISFLQHPDGFINPLLLCGVGLIPLYIIRQNQKKRLRNQIRALEGKKPQKNEVREWLNKEIL